jgi:hypothetical protein
MKATRILMLMLALLLIVSGVAATPALLQSVERPRHVVGSGATAATGNITMRATLGQPFVGLNTNGDVTLGHGFWHGEVDFTIYLPLVLRDY